MGRAPEREKGTGIFNQTENLPVPFSTLTDELNHVSTYTYDGLDRLEKKAFPDGSYQSSIFDATGNVTSQRTTAGNTIASEKGDRHLFSFGHPTRFFTSSCTSAHHDSRNALRCFLIASRSPDASARVKK